MAAKRHRHEDHITDASPHFEESFADPTIDNLRVDKLTAVIQPQLLMEEIPCDTHTINVVYNTRQKVADIVNVVYNTRKKRQLLSSQSCLPYMRPPLKSTHTDIIIWRDDRIFVVAGPCSIHDPASALEYANKLKEAQMKYADNLLLVMRVYFEKPRTTVGWKGLINDPDMNDTFYINKGLRIARTLLRDINKLGVPVGTEFLDSMIPQYLAEFVSWGAIGARTSECQLHRELASGLSMPIGFKNATSGSTQVAVDACVTARYNHTFLGITKQGLPAIVHSKGNKDSHVILRGGTSGTNYDSASIGKTVLEISHTECPPFVVVDCSHGNSLKDYKKQMTVIDDLCTQVSKGDKHVCGVMIESNIFEGKQSIPTIHTHTDQNSCTMYQQNQAVLKELKYGVSVTDACVDWEETLSMLEKLASAVNARRHSDNQ